MALMQIYDGLISIHALREEGDLPAAFSRTTDKKFQSTPSARRATAKSMEKYLTD